MYLKRNNALQFIDLSGNGLGKKSVGAIAQLLKRNGQKLTHLDLSCNKIGNYNPAATEAAPEELKGITAAIPVIAQPDIAGKTLLEAISLNKVL